jgi:hypothetical protein
MEELAILGTSSRSSKRCTDKNALINQVYKKRGLPMPKTSDDVNQHGSARHSTTVHKTGHSGSRRAQLLAARIEEGAANLAAFAEALSDAEWHTPLSATDRRSVGVVVHHVANMYPIEIDLARAVASGRSVSDVTWAAVAQLNAKHAQDNAQVSKSVALDLLRQNSGEAAAAVRAFTDQELDKATPFSLNFGAPMTAQFVIEDHAMRHSWHHLAAIRKALGR